MANVCGNECGKEHRGCSAERSKCSYTKEKSSTNSPEISFFAWTSYFHYYWVKGQHPNNFYLSSHGEQYIVRWNRSSITSHLMLLVLKKAEVQMGKILDQKINSLSDGVSVLLSPASIVEAVEEWVRILYVCQVHSAASALKNPGNQILKLISHFNLIHIKHPK